MYDMAFEKITFRGSLETTGVLDLLAAIDNKRYIVEQLTISLNSPLGGGSVIIISSSGGDMGIIKHGGDGTYNIPLQLQNIYLPEGQGLSVGYIAENDEVVTFFGHARIQG